jgi:hypothetical protein
LAVNKQGVIRGNYTDNVTNTNQTVQGSVDKQSQRLAFTVGKNTMNIAETGLYNLTKDEAPCLIHFGNDRTEQWLLVRLQKPETAGNCPFATGEFDETTLLSDEKRAIPFRVRRRAARAGERLFTAGSPTCIGGRRARCR